jgi:hypothetical protein
MTIVINGSGTITGLSAGGLPDASVTTAEIADSNVTTAKIADLNVTNAKLEADAITTDKIAALSPAFGIEIDYRWDTFDELSFVYRIPIEFWVKHGGTPSSTMQRARNIGDAALLALLIGDGAGYQLVFEDAITINVDPAFTTLNSQSWLVATMFVNVRTVESA